MDRFDLANMIQSTKPVDRESFILSRCSGKAVLDVGCVRHSADFALKDPNWLHKKIKAVASKVVGIDYLPEEIKKINAHGYNIIFGDVTKPLNLTEKFDVIFAGDIIEHLVNFEGFFINCKDFLKPEGILIITTGNPFFAGQFHYLSFRKNFVLNPEHTCWIDPLCMAQLGERFEFTVKETAYFNKSWPLSGLICETKKHPYDILNGKWCNDTVYFRIRRKIVKLFFAPFYFFYKILAGGHSKLCRYSDFVAVLKHGSAH